MTALNLDNLVEAARDLRSYEGENKEYDKALVELVAYFLPGDPDSNRDYAETIILGVILG